MSFLKLEDRCAIITGAGNGIGKASAELLAQQGAKVVVADIEEDSAKKAANSINASGGSAWGISCDIAKFDDIMATIQMSLEWMGTIDILVNNAAVGGIGRTILELDYEEWNRIVHVDLHGTFTFCREVWPHMIKKNYGKIINVSSLTAVRGVYGSVPYGSAKAGVIGMTKSLALEGAKHRINVNAIAPGLIDTRMSRARGIDDVIPFVPWPRIGYPIDCANTIAFLASDVSEFITGQIIGVNGGQYLGGH